MYLQIKLWVWSSAWRLMAFFFITGHGHIHISESIVLFISTVEVTGALCVNVLAVLSWCVCSRHFCSRHFWSRHARFTNLRLLRRWNMEFLRQSCGSDDKMEFPGCLPGYRQVYHGHEGLPWWGWWPSDDITQVMHLAKQIDWTSYLEVCKVLLVWIF